MFNTLDEVISYIESRFSLPDRELNTKQETYQLETKEIIGDVAFLSFMKSSGYRALAVAIQVKGRWQYFFPKYSHLEGLEMLKPRFNALERFNRMRQLNGIPGFVSARGQPNTG